MVVVVSCVLEVIGVGSGAGVVTIGVSVTVVVLVVSSLVATGVSVTLTVDVPLFGAVLTFVFVPAIAALPLPGALLLV